MKSRRICTYCGERKPVTRDHVFPTCIFFESSNDRSIKVDSCGDCNWRSQEGLLKTFMAMFDERIMVSRVREVAHPKSRGDLCAFLNIYTKGQGRVYLEDSVTKLFKKMMLGLRRYLLDDEWTFVPKEALVLFAITWEENTYVMRPLPMKVGGPNPGCVVPEHFNDNFENLQHQFRDFSFDMDTEGTFILKYHRTWENNQLLLVGFVISNDCDES